MVSIFSLAGRTAVITGGASGIGLACADAFANEGCDLVLIDIDTEELEIAKERLTVGNSGSILTIAGDVSDENFVQSLPDQIISNSGQINVLVNNAGISPKSVPLHEISYADWSRVLRVNLDSVFLMTRALIPQMLKAKNPSIINVASISGMVGLTKDFLFQAAYCASKSAIIGLTRQIATEYGEYGLRCNAVAPGWHLGTRLGESSANFAGEQEILRQRVSQRATLGRPGEAHELAGLFLLLASNASTYINGSVIIQDGGWTSS